MCKKDRQLEKVIKIRSNHGKGFENSLFTKFCNKHGINYEFSALETPQHNGVEEGKNIALQEVARVMLEAKNVPIKF